MTDHPLEIALVLNDNHTDSHAAISLLRAGFTVYICANHRELQALLQKGKRPIILADTAIHRNNGTAPLLAIPPFSLYDSTRFTASPTQEEVSRIVAALDHEQTSSWRLASRPDRLISPEDVVLPLTAAERGFLLDMLRHPDQLLPFDNWHGTDGLTHAQSARKLAVLTNRLKNKARNKGIALPVVSVRRLGYRFTSPCLVEPDEEKGAPSSP